MLNGPEDREFLAILVLAIAKITIGGLDKLDAQLGPIMVQKAIPETCTRHRDRAETFVNLGP